MTCSQDRSRLPSGAQVFAGKYNTDGCGGGQSSEFSGMAADVVQDPIFTSGTPAALDP